MKIPLPKEKIVCSCNRWLRDMWFLSFAMEYLRKNEKVRETFLPIFKQKIIVENLVTLSLQGLTKHPNVYKINKPVEKLKLN